MYNVSYSHVGNFGVTENKMIIEVQSVDYRNRQEPIQWLDLLIDTGAFITMLSKATAEENDYHIIQSQGCKISGFSQKELLCDLRKIPIMVFCGYTVMDVIIATPHDDNVLVSEVLGMNILENFDFGINQEKREIYLNHRVSFVSEKPKYKSGEVSFFSETSQYVHDKRMS
jgi:predicted aspartyl protease